MADTGVGEPFSGGTDGVSRKNSRIKKTLIFLTLGALAAGGGFFAWNRYFVTKETGPTTAAPIDLPEIPAVADAEPEPTPELKSDAPYQSENFRVGEIAIGGETGLFVPESDPTPLEIASVRGEAFTEKGKNDSKLVITWETNKPALSEISYGKGIGTAEGIIREENYGTSHSVVIPDLAPASTYVYVISSQDKWGNSAESDPYAVYTGAREVSLFELIAGAVGDVFGWAVDR